MCVCACVCTVCLGLNCVTCSDVEIRAALYKLAHCLYKVLDRFLLEVVFEEDKLLGMAEQKSTAKSERLCVNPL